MIRWDRKTRGMEHRGVCVSDGVERNQRTSQRRREGSGGLLEQPDTRAMYLTIPPRMVSHDVASEWNRPSAGEATDSVGSAVANHGGGRGSSEEWAGKGQKTCLQGHPVPARAWMLWLAVQIVSIRDGYYHSTIRLLCLPLCSVFMSAAHGRMSWRFCAVGGQPYVVIPPHTEDGQRKTGSGC